jgi:hypothetical protein
MSVMGKAGSRDDRRPYVETKGQLAGLPILEARDLHAIQLISRHSGMKLGTNEIRPVADLNMMKESEQWHFILHSRGSFFIRRRS